MRTDVNTSRRLFLRSAATATLAAPAVLVAGQAQAFRLLPQDDFATMLENSCVADSQQQHQKILADVQKELGIKLDESEAQEMLKQMSCPFCGCNLQTAYVEKQALGGGF